MIWTFPFCAAPEIVPPFCVTAPSSLDALIVPAFAVWVIVAALMPSEPETVTVPAPSCVNVCVPASILTAVMSPAAEVFDWSVSVPAPETPCESVILFAPASSVTSPPPVMVVAPLCVMLPAAVASSDEALIVPSANALPLSTFTSPAVP